MRTWLTILLMTQVRGLFLSWLTVAALSAPEALAQKLSAEMMNVKAWQGKLTIKGNASGVINGTKYVDTLTIW